MIDHKDSLRLDGEFLHADAPTVRALGVVLRHVTVGEMGSKYYLDNDECEALYKFFKALPLGD